MNDTVRTIDLYEGPMPGTADNGVPAGTPLVNWLLEQIVHEFERQIAHPEPIALPTWDPATDIGGVFKRHGKRPRVGDLVATGAYGHGVCTVAAVRDQGRDLTVTTADGRAVDVTRAAKGSWVIMRGVR